MRLKTFSEKNQIKLLVHMKKKTKKHYKMCNRCIMDTSDPSITFNKKGLCRHCVEYDHLVSIGIFDGQDGLDRLEKIIHEIKEYGHNKKYDCIIGLSGGLDSSYTLHKICEYELRPLVVHLDNGWNSELAVSNISKLLTKLDIDLDTYVIPWNEFKDLQISFLYASTPDIEIVTDHAITSYMYQAAKKNNIKYIISGSNIRTETHVPLSWSQGHNDWKYIESVQKKFGSVPITSYPHRTREEDLDFKNNFKWLAPLNYLEYKKYKAINLLSDVYDWKYYSGKHYESIFTRFYQGYILPRKFGYDKRRGHLSSLICSGEVERDEALLEMTRPPYPDEIQRKDYDYVIKKLDLSKEEFEKIMDLPLKTILDYPSYATDDLYKTKRTLYSSFIRNLKGLKNSFIKNV
jgi:N-acetyl sugar amidotransferase